LHDRLELSPQILVQRLDETVTIISTSTGISLNIPLRRNLAEPPGTPRCAIPTGFSDFEVETGGIGAGTVIRVVI